MAVLEQVCDLKDRIGRSDIAQEFIVERLLIGLLVNGNRGYRTWRKPALFMVMATHNPIEQ